jgi:hypothetical protein
MALATFYDASDPAPDTAADGVAMTRHMVPTVETAMSGVALTDDGLGVTISERGAYLWMFGFTGTAAGAGSLSLAAGWLSDVVGSAEEGEYNGALSASYLHVNDNPFTIRPSVTPHATSITSLSAWVLHVYRIASFDVD